LARNVIEVIAKGKDFVTPSLGKISSSLGKLQKSVFSLRSAFFALGVGFSGQRIKDLALFTANVDLLRLSMEQLARVNGINIKFLDATVTVMKSMGVATDDAIRSLNSFIRLNLDLTKATKFVRVAQDLAVVSQKTTSQVVEQLTRGVTTLNARMLRSAGVFFTAEQAAKNYEKIIGVAAGKMSVAQKQAAVLNMIIEDGEKVAGAYEASLSLAGKKVLQLNRLWKEAKLALGEFTQEALKIGVESIQDFLKSIVNLRESGRLDEFGRSMASVLVTVVRTIRSLSNAVISSGKFLFEWRKALLLVVEAFIAWKIISTVIVSINSLSAALLAAEGSAIAPFLVSVQRLTVEFGLLGAASVSVATALTIFGTALIGIGLGKLIGDLIATSSAMENFRQKVLAATIPDALKEFVDEWIFGALLVQDLEKETTKLLAENVQQRIALRLKEAKKIQEELAAEEQARRKVNDAEQEFLTTRDSILKLRDKSLSKQQKEIIQINELRNNLLATAEVLKTVEPEAFIDPEGVTELISVLDDLREKSKIELKVELFKGLEDLEEGFQAELELIKLQNEEKLALAEQFGIDKATLDLVAAEQKRELGNRELEEFASSMDARVQIAARASEILSNIDKALIASGQKRNKALFAAAKSAAIAQAIVNTAVAVTKALAAFPPPISFIMAGLTAAAGATEIAVIAATAFAKGGIVNEATLGLVGEEGPEAIIPLNSPAAADLGIGSASRNRNIEGSPLVVIEKMELFPNITDGEFLLNLPRTTLERWAREELIPVFDTLDDRGIRPVRSID
jgi:hypothetical protein